MKRKAKPGANGTDEKDLRKRRQQPTLSLKLLATLADHSPRSNTAPATAPGPGQSSAEALRRARAHNEQLRMELALVKQELNSLRSANEAQGEHQRSPPRPPLPPHKHVRLSQVNLSQNSTQNLQLHRRQQQYADEDVLSGRMSPMNLAATGLPRAELEVGVALGLNGADFPAYAEHALAQSDPLNAVEEPAWFSQRLERTQARPPVLRREHVRLLLLRHASKCKSPPGTCSATPHCAALKELWAHMIGCSDPACLIPQCVSSRQLLNHYSNCKSLCCPICSPVRDAIRRRYERACTCVSTCKLTRSRNNADSSCDTTDTPVIVQNTDVKHNEINADRSASSCTGANGGTASEDLCQGERQGKRQIENQQMHRKHLGKSLSRTTGRLGLRSRTRRVYGCCTDLKCHSA